MWTKKQKEKLLEKSDKYILGFFTKNHDAFTEIDKDYRDIFLQECRIKVFENLKKYKGRRLDKFVKGTCNEIFLNGFEKQKSTSVFCVYESELNYKSRQYKEDRERDNFFELLASLQKCSFIDTDKIHDEVDNVIYQKNKSKFNKYLWQQILTGK